MPLRIHPLAAADALAFVKLQYAAVSPIFGAFFKSPPTESTFKILAAQHNRELLKPTTHAFKAVDSITNKIVGGAIWYVYPNSRSDKEMQEEAENETYDFAPEQNPDAILSFGERIASRYHDTVGGRPCVVLHLLAVQPGLQGKGIGKSLMKWGIEEADRLGVISYLESSKAGQPMYEKYGYKTVGTVDWDASPWGQTEPFDVNAIMIREPGSGLKL